MLLASWIKGSQKASNFGSAVGPRATSSTAWLRCCSMWLHFAWARPQAAPLLPPRRIVQPSLIFSWARQSRTCERCMRPTVCHSPYRLRLRRRSGDKAVSAEEEGSCISRRPPIASDVWTRAPSQGLLDLRGAAPAEGWRATPRRPAYEVALAHPHTGCRTWGTWVLPAGLLRRPAPEAPKRTPACVLDQEAGSAKRSRATSTTFRVRGAGSPPKLRGGLLAGGPLWSTCIHRPRIWWGA